MWSTKHRQGLEPWEGNRQQTGRVGGREEHLYLQRSMMLKLKLQYFGRLMQRVDSLEKTLMLGGIAGRRKRVWHRMRWLDGITDLMDVSLSELLESIQTHVHRVGDAIQPSHPLSSPTPPALNISQHQSLFKWVSSLYQVAKVLEFQLQHHSFQRTPRTDLL